MHKSKGLPIFWAMIEAQLEIVTSKKRGVLFYEILQLFLEELVTVCTGYKSRINSIDCTTKCTLQGAKQTMNVTVLASFNLKCHWEKLVPRTLKQKLGDDLTNKRSKIVGKANRNFVKTSDGGILINRSDEGLTLETSAFLPFTVAN